MRVLFDHPVPFLLAHGGFQIQIQQTQLALQLAGVQAEPLRWWDSRQSGDVLHYFGRMPTPVLRLAQQKGLKVVLGDLLTEQGSRSRSRRTLQKVVRRGLEAVLPGFLLNSFHWQSYRLADACVALTPWEAHLLAELFGASARKIHVVPNGVEEVFLQSQPASRGPWLVCTATLTARKRVLELAESAVRAQVPVWIIGRPYADTDPYAARFLQLAKAQPQWVRYEGAIDDRGRLARIYREARGFVLLSTMESLSLSALEAAACGCPLLLSDLPWARTVFQAGASYCPVGGPVHRTAAVLRRFYDLVPELSAPPKPLSWLQVAQQLKGIYEELLRPSPRQFNQSL
jgi:glycosyltransferase involved in cell wall biosynthesis